MQESRTSAGQPYIYAHTDHLPCACPPLETLPALHRARPTPESCSFTTLLQLDLGRQRPDERHRLWLFIRSLEHCIVAFRPAFDARPERQLELCLRE